MGLKVKFEFIPFPLAITDDEDTDLSLGEYRLLGFLLRHRFRLGRERFRMTQDELLNGTLNSEGQRTNKGCKITSPRDLKIARESLVERGWIKAENTPDGMVYEILLSADEDEELDNSSAKRTRGRKPKPSAFCTVSECILSENEVQNALPNNKEVRSIKNIQEEYSPPPPGEEDEFAPVEDEKTFVRKVFAYYCERFGRDPRRYSLTDIRLKKAILRYRERKKIGGHDGARQDFFDAINKLASSDYHITNGYYDWVDHLFKSPEVFEKRLDWRTSGNGHSNGGTNGKPNRAEAAAQSVLDSTENAVARLRDMANGKTRGTGDDDGRADGFEGYPSILDGQRTLGSSSG